MRVFVTGATGFVGQVVVKELLEAGHTVVGLARSDASAAALQERGVDVIRGTLADLDVLKRGAAESDGVINLAFNHDFTKFEANIAEEMRAIQALGSALAGSNKPFVSTGGALSLPRGKLGTEDDGADLTSGMAGRAHNENEALKLASQGVRVSVIRLPPTTHGEGDKGFVNAITQFARGKGESVYIGDGANRWPAVHRTDAARLYRLALEKGVAGSIYHGVAEESIKFKDIAEAVGKSVGVPAVSKTLEEAVKHFEGFLAYPVSFDNPASSKKTQQELGWNPTARTLSEDIEAGVYTA